METSHEPYSRPMSAYRAKILTTYNSKYDDNHKIMCKNSKGFGVSVDETYSNMILLGTLENSDSIRNATITFSRKLKDVSFELIISSTIDTIIQLTSTQSSDSMYAINNQIPLRDMCSMYTLKIIIPINNNQITFDDVHDMNDTNIANVVVIEQIKDTFVRS